MGLRNLLHRLPVKRAASAGQGKRPSPSRRTSRATTEPSSPSGPTTCRGTKHIVTNQRCHCGGWGRRSQSCPLPIGLCAGPALALGPVLFWKAPHRSFGRSPSPSRHQSDAGPGEAPTLTGDKLRGLRPAPPSAPGRRGGRRRVGAGAAMACHAGGLVPCWVLSVPVTYVAGPKPVHVGAGRHPGAASSVGSWSRLLGRKPARWERLHHVWAHAQVRAFPRGSARRNRSGRRSGGKSKKQTATAGWAPRTVPRGSCRCRGATHSPAWLVQRRRGDMQSAEARPSLRPHAGHLAGPGPAVRAQVAGQAGRVPLLSPSSPCGRVRLAVGRRDTGEVPAQHVAAGQHLPRAGRLPPSAQYRGGRGQRGWGP